MLSWLEGLRILHIPALCQNLMCLIPAVINQAYRGPSLQFIPHGPRGGIATQQRRRERQPRRLSTASLTTATTAHHPEKPSSPTAGESRIVKATSAIDSSYVNNYGGRGAAGSVGDGRMGDVRHTEGPHPRGTAPARPSKWRRQRRACVRNFFAVAPRPAGSEVLGRAARSVRRLRASGG